MDICVLFKRTCFPNLPLTVPLHPPEEKNYIEELKEVKRELTMHCKDELSEFYRFHKGKSIVIMLSLTLTHVIIFKCYVLKASWELLI